MMKIAFVLYVALSSLIPFKYVSDTDEELKGDYVEELTEFEETAKNAYGGYSILEKQIEKEYVYEIIIGEYKNDYYYDIFFYNITSELLVRVDIDDVEYELELKQDGDHPYFSTNSITRPKNSQIKVYLFNGLTKSNINTIPNDYSTQSYQAGNQNGVIVNYLDPVDVPDKGLVLIIAISVCVIFVCLTGLGIFYIIKIGKKNASPLGYEKNIPQKEITSAQVLYGSYNVKQEDIKIDVSVDDELKETDISADNVISDNVNNVEENQETSVFDKSPKYSDEEQENINEVDIKSLLMMKGYKTDYSLMTEKEKNDTMVYLMVLRKTNQISYDQYSKEVVKLWKK